MYYVQKINFPFFLLQNKIMKNHIINLLNLSQHCDLLVHWKILEENTLQDQF